MGRVRSAKVAASLFAPTVVALGRSGGQEAARDVLSDRQAVAVGGMA
jgi:hypothetical protein